MIILHLISFYFILRHKRRLLSSSLRFYQGCLSRLFYQHRCLGPQGVLNPLRDTLFLWLVCFFGAKVDRREPARTKTHILRHHQTGWKLPRNLHLQTSDWESHKWVSEFCFFSHYVKMRGARWNRMETLWWGEMNRKWTVLKTLPKWNGNGGR